MLLSPQKKLLILDLNGVLIYRNQKQRFVVKPRTFKAGKTHIWLRPSWEEFLAFCSDNFEVAIWSSVKAENLAPILKVLFQNVPPPKFVFDQSHCVETKHPDENSKKPLFLKPLSKVWAKYPAFNSKNTIILDDSPLKMVRNPVECCIIVDEWHPDSTDISGLDTLKKLILLNS